MNTRSEKPCPSCGEKNFCTGHMGKEAERMRETGLCFNCASLEMRCEAGAAVIIDNYVYTIRPEPRSDDDHRFLGMAGRRFDIEFFDGRKITTHNLWAGGLIPERYRDRLPNTAKFMSGGRSSAGGITCWDPADERASAYPPYIVEE